MLPSPKAVAIGRGTHVEDEPLLLRSFGANPTSFRLIAAAILVLTMFEAIAAVHVYADLHPKAIPPSTDTASFDTEWVTLRYPSNWEVQSFDNSQFEFGGPGVLVSNLSHTFRHPDCALQQPCATTLWDLRNLPEAIVLIEVTRLNGVGPLSGRVPDFPVTLAELDETRLGSAYGGPQPHRQSLVAAGSHIFGVTVWVGDDATPASADAAEAVVESMSAAR